MFFQASEDKKQVMRQNDTANQTYEANQTTKKLYQVQGLILIT